MEFVNSYQLQRKLKSSMLNAICVKVKQVLLKEKFKALKLN